MIRAAKDLDGLMENIADDVVTYEHEQPLQRVGRSEVREVCRRSIDSSASGTVDWAVPEMTVVVREDLAVAWGLNRVDVELPDGASIESWSRGTRVFRRRGDTWAMTHQHLSVPLDRETGETRTDLRP